MLDLSSRDREKIKSATTWLIISIVAFVCFTIAKHKNKNKEIL